MELLSKKHFPLTISIMIVVLTLSLRDLAGVSVPDFAVLGIYVVLMAWLSYDKLVPFLFFSFPIFCGIPGYIMLAGFIFLIKKGGFTLRQFIPLAIIALLDIVDEGLNFNPATWSGLLSFLSFCGVFFYLINDRRNLYDIRTCILCFALGTLFTFVVIFINMFKQYDIGFILAGMARSGALGVKDNDTKEMMGHLAMNANTIAYYAICSVSCLIVNFNAYKSRLAIIAIILTILICGLLSISRTFVLCLALFVALYLISGSAKSKILFIVIAALCFCVLSYFAADYMSDLFDSFSGRANSSNAATAGGRTVIFEEYNNAWIKSMWYIVFGCGVVDHLDLLQCSNAMHSGLQQIWVCLGLCGMLLFIQQIGGFIHRYFRIKYIIYILPFIVTFLLDQSIQFLNPYPLMLPIAVSLLLVKQRYLDAKVKV